MGKPRIPEDDREWGEKPEIFFFGSWGLRVRFLVGASRPYPAFPRYGRMTWRSSIYRKNIESRIAIDASNFRAKYSQATAEFRIKRI
jgi:hypothetical protein